MKEAFVSEHLIKTPYVTDPSQNICETLTYMQDCNLRHLPVLEDAQLVGLVTERDLKLARIANEDLSVEDVMKTDLFIVHASSPMNEVVREMAVRKVGSVLVVNDNRELVGVFTVTDALLLLATMGGKGRIEKFIFDDEFQSYPETL